jgi:hypothetical protein
MSNPPSPLKSHEQLQQECAPIFYKEIERFFAKGMLVLVSNRLNIIDVALVIQADDTSQLNKWIKAEKVIRVNDHHAIKWSEDQAQLLAVTAVPWLLVQEIPAA